MRLQLDNARDQFNLDDVLNKEFGVQALTGVAGLGLPPVSVQWLEGAGDGAIYRGRRVRPRDIDLPLLIQGRDRTQLKELLGRLAVMLADPCTLRLVEDDGTDWSTEVVRVGGGDFVYGKDTVGTTELSTVVTLRAGDPFWTYSRTSRKTISNSGAGRGLLGGLAAMKVSSSQAIGTITLENIGNAVAYPVWEIRGPGRDFKAVSPTGQTLHWIGGLNAGQRLVLDTRAGTVVDHTGTSRYAQLAPAPRFFTIPPGTSTATASLENVGAGASITCTWRPRNWMVI